MSSKLFSVSKSLGDWLVADHEALHVLYSLEQFIAQVSIKTIVCDDVFAPRSGRDA